MRRIKNWLLSLKLNQKISLLVVGALFLPIIFFMLLLFSNMKTASMNETSKMVEYELAKSVHTIEQNVEMCSLSTQVIRNSQLLNDYLKRFHRNQELETKELLSFYNTEIKNIEKIVNSNPYLYQIRIYVDSDTMKEMMPLLYNRERMQTLSWAQEGKLQSGVWHLDYKDNLFPQYVLNQTEHIVSLVTILSDTDNGDYAVAEVATAMETMFPDIYDSDRDRWMCFVDADGVFYYNESREEEWLQAGKEIFAERSPKGLTQEGCYEKVKSGGKSYVVGIEPVKVLNGHLLKLVSLKGEEREFAVYSNLFLLMLVMILSILIFFFHGIVNKILKQFYDITGVMHQVQQGDMEVRVSGCRKDEIGTLGRDLNEMLDRIQKLMEENVNREVLIKDSQIRALQNQINAHFIYNVLESIKMMAEIDEKYEISDAVTSLGKLLRYSMRWKSQTVTVEDEVEYIRNYLALINLRFDYEIYLSINMPETMWRQKIPKMSLQPIIENAINHGVEEIAENTSIYMKGVIEGSMCMIKITDAGKGMSKEQTKALRSKINGGLDVCGGEGNGIGLKNVQDRIRISFGKGYGLEIASEEGYYTQVIVKIPYETEEG